MKNIHLDTFIGIFLLIVSVFFYSLTAQMPDDPAVFPKLVLLVLMVFSVLIMCKGITKTIKAKRDNLMVERYFENIRGPASVYIGLCVYVFLIQLLGFFVASSISSVFFMVLFGIKSYFKIFLLVIGINVFVYLLFVWQLKIALPTGLLI
jgi:hypothetical protein